MTLKEYKKNQKQWLKENKAIIDLLGNEPVCWIMQQSLNGIHSFDIEVKRNPNEIIIKPSES